MPRAATAATSCPAAALGVLQGHQRFNALASLYVIPWFIRLAILGVVAAAGYRLGGAVFSMLAAALVSMATLGGVRRAGARELTLAPAPGRPR